MDKLAWPSGLNIATQCFPENRTQGLMICGFEWGGSPDAPSDPEDDGFFSQAGVNEYPYRSRLLGWFDLFGHRLETEPAKAGPFEKSILQTNWLPTQARAMTGRDTLRECVSGWPNFRLHLKELQPRLIMFVSATLLEALNAESCIKEAEQIFGKSEPPTYPRKNVIENGSPLKAFRLGFQEFERTSVIALPHPTGAQGLTNDYLAAFKSEVGSRIQSYKTFRGFDH